MKKWDHAIRACIENGRKLTADAELLDGSPAARALAILAQEEFAKAFMLRLVNEGAIPMCEEVLHACRDHSCKHLLGLVMLHLFTPIDDMLLRNERVADAGMGEALPASVADALNIFCHEKLWRWRSENWGWENKPAYDKKAKAIARGSLDREKQDLLYVGIDKDGQVRRPNCTPDQTAESIKAAKMLEEVAGGGDVWAFAEASFVKRALVEMLKDF